MRPGVKLTEHSRHTILNPKSGQRRISGMAHCNDPTPAMATPAVATTVAGAAGRARVIRRRLMERMADADLTHLTIAGGEGEWQPFLQGVRIKVLHEQAGVLSYLLRMEPGACLPPHRHPKEEECIVIEGSLRVGTRTAFGPGSYHLAHRGALHATISTETGATIFLRGAVPQADQILE